MDGFPPSEFLRSLAFGSLALNKKEGFTPEFGS
jgi:hypothetical protein